MLHPDENELPVEYHIMYRSVQEPLRTEMQQGIAGLPAVVTDFITCTCQSQSVSELALVFSRNDYKANWKSQSNISSCA